MLDPSAPVNLKEFVAGFVVEAEEYLDSVNRNLVIVAEALKQSRPEPRAVRELFRSLHTIKGLAAMVGAEPIVEIAHEMESILRQADKAGGVVSDRTLDLLMKGSRAVEERVDVVSKNGISAIPVAPALLLESLALAVGSGIPSSAPAPVEFSLPEDVLKSLSLSEKEQLAQALKANHRVVLIDFSPSPERAERGQNITSVRSQLSKLGELVKVIPRSAANAPTGIIFSLLLVTDANDSELAQAADLATESILNVSMPDVPLQNGLLAETTQEDGPQWTPSDHSSIRIDIRRLDEALERLSDLVVTRAKLERAVAALTASGVDTRELGLVIAENRRQLKRLRAAITKARMVSLAELLQRLPLVVRGLTKESEKSVDLTMQVGSAEVDKSVADKIFPAIVHLVRNAVDHAIESVDERERLGKPATGALSVTCDDSTGTSLLLTIRDDGRGIDREAVARKAGLAVAKSDEELLQQISEPGLSTREDVTTTSGRGMGMDIVKRTVELLGGQLSLSTIQGVGTSFTLQIPVSITIVDVLSFMAGERIYAVPLAMVEEIIELDSARAAPSPTGRGIEAKLIERRGEAIPLIAVEDLMRGSRNSSAKTALIVKHPRGGAIAFGVDRMLGQQEAVVRPLEDPLVRVEGFSGATDLGDGRPTLVLDLATMGATMNKSVEAIL